MVATKQKRKRPPPAANGTFPNVINSADPRDLTPRTRRILGFDEANGTNTLHGALCDNCGWPDGEQKTESRPIAKARNGSPAMPHPNPESAPITGRASVMVAVDNIVPSRWQPRQQFDQAELEKLATTIKTHGLLQPIVVRKLALPRGKQLAEYELIAGERRLRATKLAGLAEISTEVIDVDDRQAAELTVLENLQRADLSAIEEAQGYQTLLTQAPGLTQEQLGGRLGKSQAHIAQRLALLKLPKCWQERIITREIPPTHARCLGRWAEVPELVAAINKRIGKGEVDQTLGQFEHLVLQAVYFATADLAKTEHDYTHGWRESPRLKPSAEERQALRLIKVPAFHGKQEQERALNVKLFNQLFAKHIAAWKKSRDKKQDQAAKKDQRDLTPAELKAKHKKQAEQLGRRLREWRYDWLRWLVYQEISSDRVLTEQLWKLALAVPAWFKAGGFGTPDLDESIERALPEARDIENDLLRLEPQRLPRVVRTAIAGWFWDPQPEKVLDGDDGPPPLGQPESCVISGDVERIAAWLSIDLEAAWRREQAGPLTEAYWEMHNKEQLERLGKEVDVFVDPAKPKATAVRLLAHPGRAIPMPAEIERLEGTKAQRGKGTTKSKPRA